MQNRSIPVLKIRSCAENFMFYNVGLEKTVHEIVEMIKEKKESGSERDNNTDCLDFSLYQPGFLFSSNPEFIQLQYNITMRAVVENLKNNCLDHYKENGELILGATLKLYDQEQFKKIMQARLELIENEKKQKARTWFLAVKQFENKNKVCFPEPLKNLILKEATGIEASQPASHKPGCIIN